MRNIYVLVTIFMCFFLFNHCAEKQVEQDLMGTWRMISGIYITPDDTVTCNVDVRLCTKILSHEHFAVVEMYLSKPDSQFFAAVGSYTHDDSVYTEILEGCNVVSDVGRTNVFHSELNNNEWRICLQREDMELDETWVRIKRP